MVWRTILSSPMTTDFGEQESGRPKEGQQLFLLHEQTTDGPDIPVNACATMVCINIFEKRLNRHTAGPTEDRKLKMCREGSSFKDEDIRRLVRCQGGSRLGSSSSALFTQGQQDTQSTCQWGEPHSSCRRPEQTGQEQQEHGGLCLPTYDLLLFCPLQYCKKKKDL